MTDLPDPLVPADCDLAGYGFMPLHGHRLFGSDFNARCTDSEWRAGVTLWWAAWNQVPAGSLPDDDVALCRLADLGRDVKAWIKLRANALHGFIACSDGRLYHPVLASLALDAWDRRVRDRERKARWRAGRDGDRYGDGTGTRRGQVRDVPAEAKRQGQGEGHRESPPPSPSSDSSRACASQSAAAATPCRIGGVRPEAVAEAVIAMDLFGLVRAFGGNVNDDRAAEWRRDADGLTLHGLAAILAWRRSIGDPIREPSGLRAARAQFRSMTVKERDTWSLAFLEWSGLPIPDNSRLNKNMEDEHARNVG